MIRDRFYFLNQKQNNLLKDTYIQFGSDIHILVPIEIFFNLSIWKHSMYIIFSYFRVLFGCGIARTNFLLYYCF